MNELISINPSPNGNGFQIPFKQGTLKIKDEPGGYVISSGCGSGKTESIKSLMRKMWHKGILYCVDTIAEANKIHEWILKNLVGMIINGWVLTDKDVLILHSKVDFENTAIYNNTPWELLKKKIVIITHVRLWISPIPLFLIYNPTATTLPDFDGDFNKLMTRDDLRKYIIIDEMPVFFKDFLSIPPFYLGLFSNNQSGVYSVKTRSEIESYYNYFLKGRSDDIMKKDCAYTRYVRTLMFDLIEKNYSFWINHLPAEPKDNFTVSFSPKDLIVPNMQTHLLIYEGAGDVLLGNDSKFALLDLKQKYNAIIRFQKFDFSLLRKNITTKTYNKAVSNLKMLLLGQAGKTLVVVWKNKKKKDVYSGDTEYSDRVKSDLASFSNVSVTYYGASDTKSTNDYRDYENIVLFGVWNISNLASENIKKSYRSSTTPEQYRLWYFVQLLCRIGIRNSDGKTYNVFYSSDYEQIFIDTLDQYLNSNILNLKSGKGKKIGWESKITNRSHLSIIDGLIAYNPMARKPLCIKLKGLSDQNLLEETILDDTKSYSFSITLDVLDKMSAKNGKQYVKKQKKTYDPLVKYLKNEHSITMEILNKREWKKKYPNSKKFRECKSKIDIRKILSLMPIVMIKDIIDRMKKAKEKGKKQKIKRFIGKS